MKQIIRLGPAGTPTASTLDGISYIKKHKLLAMEVEFVRGVKMTNETAKACGKSALENGISLSVHAPYYINLNSKEKVKIEASKKRILTSCERAHFLSGANSLTKEKVSVVFHPAYYGNTSKEETFEIVKNHVLEMQDEIKNKGWNISLAPETTGKSSAFGDLDETLRLAKQTKCNLCLDFAHLKARLNGKIDFDKTIQTVKEFVGDKIVHCHYSGIEYTSKGEVRHILTDLKEARLLAHLILKHKLNVVIINESPDPTGDSLKVKKVFETLGYKF